MPRPFSTFNTSFTYGHTEDLFPKSSWWMEAQSSREAFHERAKAEERRITHSRGASWVDAIAHEPKMNYLYGGKSK